MKSFFKNKNNIIIGLCLIVILMGIGFAAFSQRLEIGDTTVTSSDWNVYIKSAEAGTSVGGATGSAQVVDRATAKLTANLSSPGDSVTYTITVANDGNIDAVLDVITLSASNSDSVIKYSYAGIEEDEELLAETEKSFTVTIEYDSTNTGTITEEQKKNTLTLDLDYVQKGTETISPIMSTLNMNGVDVNIYRDGSGVDGLYADAFESGRYVYKGASPANYITFNGEEAGWRIMAVEADNTLKLIRNASIGDMAWDEGNLRDAGSSGAGGTYCANYASGYGCNAWAATANLVGGPAEFANGLYNGTVLLDASLNTYLNTTYKNTINTTHMVSHNFGVGVVGDRNYNLTEQISNEKSYQWNGFIGLMNVSDYLRANTDIENCETFQKNNLNYNTCKNTNYLFLSLASDIPWTINLKAGGTYLFYLNKPGNIAYENPYITKNGVVPVLYLSSDITLSGSGTDIDPYEIVS